MKYVSIDIETTGLSPDTCQIIEFGAVIDDMVTPFAELPTFRYRVKEDTYRGEPYALSMHAEFFAEMAARPLQAGARGASNDLVDGEGMIAGYFADWLRRNNMGSHGFTAAGKNFAEFDARFIRKLRSFGCHDGFQWHHAVLDPGPLYTLPTDVQVPSTEECIKRAGGLDHYPIPGKAHSAVYDAKVVCALLRESLGKLYA